MNQLGRLTEELVKNLTLYEKELKEERHQLREMARDKTYVLQIFDNHKYQIMLHLIFCYFWNNSHYYEHWKDEISSFIFQLPKLKSSKKYPTREDLEDWYMEEVRENLDDYLESYVYDACDKENKDIPDYDINKLKQYELDYFNWLCDNICDGKRAYRKDVYDKIDELVNKYK